MSDLGKQIEKELASAEPRRDDEGKKLAQQGPGGLQMAQAQVPSIGRVVHYQRFGSPWGEHKAEPSPAIITQVLDADTKRCQLFVMNPNGLYFNDTPYADEPTPGHWSWPPRT